MRPDEESAGGGESVDDHIASMRRWRARMERIHESSPPPPPTPRTPAPDGPTPLISDDDGAIIVFAVRGQFSRVGLRRAVREFTAPILEGD